MSDSMGGSSTVDRVVLALTVLVSLALIGMATGFAEAGVLGGLLGDGVDALTAAL